MGEIQAIKVEIAEAIKRRIQGDSRSPEDIYSVTTVALSEIVADLTFAAANDLEHARQLLGVIIVVIETRWRHLARKQ